MTAKRQRLYVVGHIGGAAARAPRVNVGDGAGHGLAIRRTTVGIRLGRTDGDLRLGRGTFLRYPGFTEAERKLLQWV